MEDQRRSKNRYGYKRDRSKRIERRELKWFRHMPEDRWQKKNIFQWVEISRMKKKEFKVVLERINQGC